MYTPELKKNHEWYSVQVQSGLIGSIIEMRQRKIVKGKLKATVHVKPKFKKGAKQELAMKLFRKHTGDNASFITVLMTELSMTKAGARTYAYNCRKA